jgi:hypothetical protein
MHLVHHGVEVAPRGRERGEEGRIGGGPGRAAERAACSGGAAAEVGGLDVGVANCEEGRVYEGAWSVEYTQSNRR